MATGRRWVLGAAVLLLLPALASAQSNLASGELRILGIQLAVSPADQQVSRNQASGLHVSAGEVATLGPVLLPPVEGERS